MKKPTVHVSNDFKTLRKQLVQQLFFAPSKPFQKKLVLLPDLKGKNELVFNFLSDVDVVMGIDFMELGSGLQFLYHHLTGRTLHFPPLDLLSLHLIPLIQEMPQLSRYRGKKGEGLAAALAMEFLRYGKFGHVELDDWRGKEGWQQSLWSALFSKWDIPAQLLDTPFQERDEPLEIHLYKFSFLPELYHHFFEKVSEKCSVHYYQFSPCSVFWTDIFSEKERFKAEKKADSKTRNEWAAYLRDRPLLLANLGRLSRQTFRFFEEEDFPLNENYEPPLSETLLSRIKRDILCFQTPEKQDLKEDQSLLIHPASCKRREVEILFSTLLTLMKEKNLKPSDVRIYAPDISLYAPFISLIFGGKDSPFAFSISDLPLDEQSPLLLAFLNLLSLNKDRFRRESVLKLFSCPAFRRQFSLSEKEVESFTKWMEKGGVKWGIDRAHRNALLSGEEMLEMGETGTWEDTFTHMLRSFTMISEERPAWEKPLLDFSDAEAFGKGMSIVRTLKEDLAFTENASLTLSEWSNHLLLLLKRYFQVSEEESYSYQWLDEKIALLEAESLPDCSFSFSPIYRYLKSAAQEKRGKKEAFQIEALRFSSLKLAAPESAPVICLLGLDENQFPRSRGKSSLCELEMKGLPTSQEEDRHLFLETLFAADSHLILSYINVNEEDGKEQTASPLIQELLAYLDMVCTLDLKKPSTVITKNHPPFLFHSDYFEEESLGLELPFLAAKKFYAPQTAPMPLIPEYLSASPLPPSGTEDLTIDLKLLSRFAKHPVRFYLNHTLRFYLQYEEKDEEFTLSPLSRALLRKEASCAPFDVVFKEADLHGKLPLGRFKDVARESVIEEIQTFKAHLASFGKPLSIDLIPPLLLPLDKGRSATIEGTLSDITSKGLLFHGEKKLHDLLKIWPLFLIFACSNVPAEKHLLLTKTGETLSFPGLDPHHALASYLLYYEKGLITPSPFLPAWSASFLEKGPEHLMKKIEAATDPYVAWIFRPNHYSAQCLFETWSPLLQDTFKPLQEAL